MLLSQAAFEKLWSINAIPDSLIQTIFEIEQDMWARWIWEYLNCDDCNEILSKSDVYSKEWGIVLPEDIKYETVMNIEKYLWTIPNCTCCGWNTAHVYDYDSYWPEIQARYSKTDSFLSLSNDDNWKVVWFMDGYIASLEEIFEWEFSYHFSPKLLDMIWEKYKKHRKERLLTVSSIWTDDKNKSLSRVFELLRSFFAQFDESYDEMWVIVESIIWSTTYCIFDLMWADKMQVGNENWVILKWTQNLKFSTDILFQSWAIAKYRDCFNLRARDIVMHSRSFPKAA